jgi:hypothetical protein
MNHCKQFITYVFMCIIFRVIRYIIPKVEQVAILATVNIKQSFMLSVPIVCIVYRYQISNS